MDVGVGVAVVARTDTFFGRTMEKGSTEPPGYSDAEKTPNC